MEKESGNRAKEEIQRLDGADEETRKRISEKVRETANENPAALLGEVPLIEPYLEDLSAKVREDLLVALGKIACEYPEEVRPAVPKIEDLAVVDTGDRSEDEELNTVEAQFALGMVAKEYPDVAAENIPRFAEATEIDNRYISNNAMALLGDLAEEYPKDVAEYLPKAVQRLDADDDRMRCNALLVVTRTAKEYPERVEREVGIDEIVGMLDASELERTREHACWALLYLGERATEAVPRLEGIAESDPAGRAQEVAKMAIEHIENRDKDWRV